MDARGPRPQDEVLRHKAPYLNTGFFLVRALVYFAGWILLAWTLTRWSRRQDEGDMSVNLRIQCLSGVGLVFYAFTITFAGDRLDHVDQPALVLDALRLPFHRRAGPVGAGVHDHRQHVSRAAARRCDTLLKPSHFHDLGKLSLAFVMLWAYFNFSQFLLIYAANLVEEIPYFLAQDQPRLAVPGAVPGRSSISSCRSSCCCRAT